MEKLNFKPNKDKIVIDTSRKEGLIIVPGDFHATKGVIVAVADNITQFKVGDKVCFKMNSGLYIEIGEKKYLIMSEFEPLGTYLEEETAN